MQAEKPVTPGTLRKLFFGKAGLRAGWSTLIFLVIMLVLALSGGQIVRLFVHEDNSNIESPLIGILKESVALVALFVATWVMAKLEKRSIFSYGLYDRFIFKRLLSGFVLGLTAISTLVAVLWWNHLLVFDGRFLSGFAIWKYAVLWGLMWLVTALLEEGLFRGYVQYTLTRGLNFWLAAIILSALFGAVHGLNPGESPVGLFAGVLFALVCCLGLRVTGSLWLPIGIHIGWDWAEGYLYGVSDSGIVSEGHLYGTHPIGSVLWSGGATGPEGSLYALLILPVLATGIWALWGRKRETALAPPPT